MKDYPSHQNIMDVAEVKGQWYVNIGTNCSWKQWVIIQDWNLKYHKQVRDNWKHWVIIQMPLTEHKSITIYSNRKNSKPGSQHFWAVNSYKDYFKSCQMKYTLTMIIGLADPDVYNQCLRRFRKLQSLCQREWLRPTCSFVLSLQLGILHILLHQRSTIQLLPFQTVHFGSLHLLL